jgi:hypothetical protein
MMEIFGNIGGSDECRRRGRDAEKMSERGGRERGGQGGPWLSGRERTKIAR